MRPAGVAARSSAAVASSEARPDGLGRPGDLEDPLGDVAEVLDRRRGPAGHADDARAVEHARVIEVADALDLDGLRPADLAQAGQLLRVRARSATDDDHQVDLRGRLHRVLLAADRDRADRVDDLELVAARHHERREALELPGWLGRLADERHPLLARDGRLPFLFLVDDDRVGREAEHADDLRMLGRAQQDDRVALLDEAGQLAVLLDDPRARAVDDLETARLGALHHVGPDAVGADDDRRTVIDVVERLDRLDAEVLEVAHDALVVDDLAEGMRRLAGRGRFLGLVDRLPDAIAEPGALRDADFFDGSHVSDYRTGSVETPFADP